MFRLRAYPPTGPVALPSWLLVPGTAAFVVSLAAFFLLKRVIGFGYYDLSVFMMGGNAFMAGLPVYQQEMPSASGSGWHFVYPPITLLIFGPLSQLPLGGAQAIVLAGGIVALGVTIWLTMRLARFQQNAGFVGASLGMAGVALWLQPVFGSLAQGQINIILMLLVLADFALDGRRRWPTGILIGIAAAAKITPGVFIIYLFLARRYRAAFTAAATFAAVTGFGFVVATRDSIEYWLQGTFANVQRFGPISVGDVSNQSLNGLAVRFLGDHGGLPWLVLALAVGTLGLMIAVAAHRRGAPLAGILTTAITGLLIAPLSWHEHWVWIVPVLIWLGAVAIQISHTSPIIAGALPVLPALPFLVWPLGTGDWRATRQIAPESILGPAGHMWSNGNHNPLIAIAGTAYVSAGLLVLLTSFILNRLSAKTTAGAAHPEVEIYPSSPASARKRTVPDITG
jgi:alpha-1,2-mannosyltransferase